MKNPPTKFDIKIVFEDDSLLIVNKPSGLIVNTAQTTKNDYTLTDWLGDSYPDVYPGSEDSEFLVRKGVVHRLDKDTSGLLVVAKTAPVFAQLQKEFKERTVQKKYFALCHGIVTPEEGSVSVPIERNPFNRKRFGVFLGGREALTNYKVIKKYRQPDTKSEFSLVDVEPKTGRTHQIRVHLVHLGYPLVSDILYSGRKNFKKDLKFCPRLFLHAYSLSIIHPATNTRREFKAELPEELKLVLKGLSEME